MEKHLTEKVRPGKAVVLLEKAALVLLALLMGGVVHIGVNWFLQHGLSLQHLLLCLVLVLLAALMNPITERMRARKHATLLVKALEAAGGSIRVEELESASKVRRAADTALQLVSKGYLMDVTLHKGSVYLGVPEEEAPAEEPAPLFRDHDE